MLRRLILAAPALALRAASEPGEILQRATVFDTENYLALKSYIWYSESTGHRRKRLIEQDKYEVNLISGSLYWRHLEHLGQPLNEADSKDELYRYRMHLQKAAQSTIFESQDWREERAAFTGFLHSHKIKRYELTSRDGLPCHYFQLEPNPRQAPYASGFRIEAWLEKESLHWVHSRWTAVRQVSWIFKQLFLGRISMLYSNNLLNQGTLFPGDSLQWTLHRIPDGPWTLDSYTILAGPYRKHLRYFDYRKFSAYSELIPE
jgi:hypothetical protein